MIQQWFIDAVIHSDQQAHSFSSCTERERENNIQWREIKKKAVHIVSDVISYKTMGLYGFIHNFLSTSGLKEQIS